MNQVAVGTSGYRRFGVDKVVNYTNLNIESRCFVSNLDNIDKRIKFI